MSQEPPAPPPGQPEEPEDPDRPEEPEEKQPKQTKRVYHIAQVFEVVQLYRATRVVEVTQVDETAPPAEEPPSPPALEPAPPARSRRGLLVALVAVAGVGVVVGAAVVTASLVGEDVPEVGDCLTGAADANDMAVVACDSERAALEVVGFDGTSWVERDFRDAAPEEFCQDYPGWERALWLGEETSDGSGEGEVACLAPVGSEPAEQ